MSEALQHLQRDIRIRQERARRELQARHERECREFEGRCQDELYDANVRLGLAVPRTHNFDGTPVTTAAR